MQLEMAATFSICKGKATAGDKEGCMDTDELESILEGQAETPSVEFKGACSWDVGRLAKDILALSNVQDGGVIIIGVEDDTFKRQGVDAAQMQSFKIEVMRDQMAAFADPHVNFTVEFSDIGGKAYVLIRVRTFEEIPVICRKDSKDTQAGRIYYRNKNRRVESAPVSNSYDMRDIVEVATVRMMQRKQRFGYIVTPASKQQFDEELGGL
jgi:predicted HTH transcriptional regulator